MTTRYHLCSSPQPRSRAGTQRYGNVTDKDRGMQSLTICAIIKDLTGGEAEESTEISALSMDDITAMEIMIAIEDSLPVEFEEVQLEEFVTVRDLVDHVHAEVLEWHAANAGNKEARQ